MSYFQDLVDEVLGNLSDQEEQESAGLKRELLPGDIMGIVDEGINRYGIYLGDNQVIHCVGPSATENAQGTVAVSELRKFLAGQTQFSVLSFERFNQDLLEKNGSYFLPSQSSPGSFEARESCERPFSLFSAEETINRALSRLNAQDSKLQLNACHNFFCWAKTGNPECSPILLAKYWDVVDL